MSKRLISLLFCLKAFSVLLAQTDALTPQDSAITWAKIPEEDLKMTVYAPDTSAAAVVLAAKGDINVNVWSATKGYQLKFKMYRRVKILNKSAFYNEGNLKISNYFNGDIGKISDIKAAIIQTNGSRQDFNQKDFFQEKTLHGIIVYKFVFPSLQEGSVIEYAYEMTSENLQTLHDWTFQEDIPVRHSELDFSVPFIYKYIHLLTGSKYLKSSQVENEQFISISTTYPFFNPKRRFWVDSLPALKSESYITTMSDYLTQIRFQLAKYKQNKHLVDHLSSWEKVAQKLMEQPSIGKQLTKKSNYSTIWQAVQPLILSAKTDDEKIKIIYKYLCENVIWDNYYSIHAETTLNDAFRKKKARSGELNMMLLVCLSEAGIKASPMLVSTREHGKPITAYPILEQFDHLVAYIERGDKSFLADVGNVNRAVGTPRIATLNEQGWVLDKDNPRWVPIVPPYSSEETSANFDLLENGTLKGSISSSYDGYAAVSERDNDDEKHEKAEKELAKKFLDIQIDSIKISNLKQTEAPFKRTVFCTIPNAAISANNLIYIKPLLKSDFEENPFKQPKREYPIDFAYPIREQFVLNLTFPEGYILEEMPKELTVSLLKNSGNFQYLTTQNENSVQIIVKIQIGQLHFEPEGYGIVKGFFEQIANKLAEQIVLKKKK